MSATAKRKCSHLMHLPSGKCLGCGEQHQPLGDYQPGDDEAYIREHLAEPVDPLPAMKAAEPLPQGDEPDRYDAGLLGDGGGGDVEWWRDYMRAELERAHEFYSDQFAALNNHWRHKADAAITAIRSQS